MGGEYLEKFYNMLIFLKVNRLEKLFKKFMYVKNLRKIIKIVFRIYSFLVW